MADRLPMTTQLLAIANCHRPTAAAILWFTMITVSGCGSHDVDPMMQLVTLADRQFRLELALTPAQQYQGLSDRDQIPSDGGMLFVFSQPEEMAFVMRGCLVPIDLIFIGPGGRIVSLHRMQVEPDPDAPDSQLIRYPSAWPIQFALELKGGTLDHLELKVGQKIDLPLDALKRRAR